MRKRKGHFEGHTYFVTPASLEHCIMQLEQLRDDDIRVSTQYENSDIATFRIELDEQGAAKVIGEGRLRRWHGTDTRVDCDIEVHEGLLTWLMLLVGFFIMMMVFLPVIFLMAAQVDVTVWATMSIAFAVTMIILMMLTRHFVPLDDTPRNLRAILEQTLS